jgi:hypothetical protein
MIYRHMDVTCPVLCIILDWGRAAHRGLSKEEKEFLDRFKRDDIYFVRLILGGERFSIEHNLNTSWSTLPSGAQPLDAPTPNATPRP